MLFKELHMMVKDDDGIEMALKRKQCWSRVRVYEQES